VLYWTLEFHLVHSSLEAESVSSRLFKYCSTVVKAIVPRPAGD
jgi:hypothetical protein